MTVECTVVGDPCGLRVEVVGRLRLMDVTPVRLQLLKCLAEQPDALLVDLAGLVVDEPMALAVFLAVSRQASRWPGIPFVLSTPPSPTHDLLAGGVLRRMPLFESVGAARKHAAEHRESLPTLRDELLPIAGAPRHARNVATDACLLWDLPHLIGPASLIVTELVSNVIDHAGTLATLQFALRPRYLTVAVRDGSTGEPVAATSVSPDSPRGRGLMLIDSVAGSWGWLPCEGGKVVWASLSR